MRFSYYNYSLFCFVILKQRNIAGVCILFRIEIGGIRISAVWNQPFMFIYEWIRIPIVCIKHFYFLLRLMNFYLNTFRSNFYYFISVFQIFGWNSMIHKTTWTVDVKSDGICKNMSDCKSLNAWLMPYEPS